MMKIPFLLLPILVIPLATCGETEPVKDKAYYLAHREELEAENRRCRNTGKIATDDDCRRIDAIRGELFREDIGRHIQTR